MKGFIYSIAVLLAVTAVIAAIPTESEAAIYEDTVRLHILANSDDDEDQETKLKIRDRVLEKYSTELGGYLSADDAAEGIDELLFSIEKDVETWLAELGCKYGAKASLSYEWYDTREYGEFTMPKGVYRSLVIELGRAEGRNWWCVMYPPMCLDIATQDLGYTSEEEALISASGYAVKFKILEIASIILEK